MHQIALRFFDVDLFLESNDDALIALFQQLYCKLKVEIADLRPNARHAHFIHTSSSVNLKIGGRQWELSTAYSKFVHNLIIYDIVQHVRSHLILHAASIAYEGQGILLVGSSMGGKTTLSLALAQQGAQLLGDDSVGIAYAGGNIDALARQVHIRPKTRLLLNMVDVPIIEPACPYPLRTIFILNNDNTNPLADYQLWFDIQQAPQAWQEELRAIPAITQLTLTIIGVSWLRCHLTLTEQATHYYRQIEQLCNRHGVLIYDVQAGEEQAAYFRENAAIRPILPSDAAFQILPHIQDRTIVEEFDGELSLYITILSLIQNTDCYQLQVGTPIETAEKIKALLR